uniref:Endonuclease-reverse transcriptase n=1 Tax=Heliothis virescens TaxID=7102 RepID=A0A2A4K1M2_HELVI
MEDQFHLLFEKMKNEMLNQTKELKESITNNILEILDEKLQPVITENKILKTKVENLEREIETLKREKKQNNLIMFGVNEDERSTQDLIQNIINIFKTDLDMQFQEHEINKIYRLGKAKSSGKPRPILLSFVSEWKKNEVMKKKKNLRNVYVTEDYTKEVLEKRKTLQAQLKEERERGNIAYLKFDKLVVKEKTNNTNNEKRKREISTSPQNNNQPKKQQTIMPPINNRPNAFDVMRIRANSLSSLPTKATSNKE